ncbi:MAG: UbiA prenyltransferase family protein, partial [Melioribacteraceae bacterium]|nr:UbiA prenyltransferase family protein [Melioribacteraceae bacterium]
MLLLFLAVGDALIKADTTYSPLLLVAVIAQASWYLNGTIINDLADIEIDKINLRNNDERPLANKKTSKKDMWKLYVLSMFFSIFTALIIHPIAALFACIALFLNYAYSYPPLKISHRGLLATVLLPVGYVGVPLALGLGIHDYNLTLGEITIIAAFYFYFAGRIILKDYRDVIGDKKFGKKTFIVRYGNKRTALMSSVFLFIGSSMLVAAVWSINNALFISLIVLFSIAILRTLLELSREKETWSQIIVVGVIGRLYNAIAVLVLLNLTLEIKESPDALTA